MCSDVGNVDLLLILQPVLWLLPVYVVYKSVLRKSEYLRRKDGLYREIEGSEGGARVGAGRDQEV